MKISSSLFFFIFCVGMGFAEGASVLSPICAKAHGPRLAMDRFSLHVLKMQNGKKMDTTSLRQELKYVVQTTDLKISLNEMQNFFGSRMKNRDQAPHGFSNITSTLYLTTAKYRTLRDEIKKAKVRFRKYFLREASDVRWENLQVAEGLKDRSWLEIKIQHPDYPNVVTKPRLLVLDRDIRYFTTDVFHAHKENLRNRLLQLNPGKAEEVENALSFFTELYSNPRRRVENLFAKTEYERESFSIKLENSKNPGEKIDVQITLDQNIRLTRLADKKKINAYSSNETVIEVKIPVAYAKLSAEDIAKFPELARIKEFVEWLNAKHNPKHAVNRGKMNKIEKDGIDKDDPENNEHFLDVLDDLSQ